jgi:hypothetical protein
MSAVRKDDNTAEVALAIRDIVYLLDFHVQEVSLSQDRDAIADHIVHHLQNYETENMAKFIGAGLPETMTELCPSLCSRLWLGIDVVPIVMPAQSHHNKELWQVKRVDEQADSMARRCIV